MKLATKTWCLLFCGISVLAVMFLVLVNYLADPYGYFSDLYYGQSGTDHISVLNTKIRYIKENPALYNGFIVGGSRTGVLDPAVASEYTEYTGLSFYNFCFPHGYQDDYEKVINFLIQNTNVKQIILQLNGQEIQSPATKYPDMYAFTSKLSSKIYELKTILLSDCTRYLVRFFFPGIFYDPKVKSNGMIEYIEKYNPTKGLNLSFVENTVLPIFRYSYGSIFSDKQEDNYPSLNFVFESLQRIKTKCLLNDVKLIIIVAPTSVPALASIESPAYWNFLRNISVLDFYNFNGYSGYNFNPYNFVDNAHYRREMGDKMLRIIFDQEPAGDDDWGILLTRDNIDAYLERRKETYLKLKTIYEETGAMVLGDMADASFIPLNEYLASP